MSLQKKLISLEEKYPNQLNKKYFHECNLTMYNLDSEQINDFFNILTNEGEKQIYFQDFSGLIQLIHSKRKKSSELIEHKTFITQKQFLFLQHNIEKVFNFEDLDTFKIEFSQILKQTNVDFQEWNDRFLTQLYRNLQDYKKNKQDFNPIMFVDTNFEIPHRERLSSIHNSFQEEDTPPQILEYIATQLNYFGKQIAQLKQKFIDPTFNSVYKDFLFFSEIVEEKKSQIKLNFKDYQDFQQKNSQELYNRKKIINKQKNQISRLLEENNSLKSECDFITQEKQRLINELKECQNELIKKDFDFQNQQLKQQEQSDIINELKNTINSLKNQKENLADQINEIQDQYNNQKQCLLKDYQNILKEQEKYIQIEENQKVEYEKKQSQQNLEKLEHAQNQILNLQKQLENFKLENRSLVERIEDMLLFKEQQEQLNLKSQQQPEDLNELDKYMTQFSIQSDSDQQPEETTEINAQINYNLEIPTQSSSEEDNSTNEKINLPQNMISQIKNIIGQKIDHRITDLPIDYKKFKDFIYICEKEYKKLQFLYYKQDVISILSPYNKSLVFQIKLENVQKIKFSSNNNFLMFIKYKDDKDTIQTILIESPMIQQLQDIFLKSTKLKQDVCESVEFLDIETDNNFNQHSINVFPKTTFQGFIKIWINSLFTDWKIYYMVLIDNVLIKIHFPQKIFYADKLSYMRSVNIYKLENFSILKTQKGMKTPNLFALKLIDEHIDYIIATPSGYHYLKWMNSLYDIFNQQLIQTIYIFWTKKQIQCIQLKQFKIIKITIRRFFRWMN